MSAYTTIQGDLGKPMPLTLRANGLPMAVPGTSTVQLRWEKPDGTITTVELSDVDRATGKFARAWSAGDTDQAGAHFGQIVVTDNAGAAVTYPDDGSHLIWTVYPKIA